jgi:hypothetical protein
MKSSTSTSTRTLVPELVHAESPYEVSPASSSPTNTGPPLSPSQDSAGPGTMRKTRAPISATVASPARFTPTSPASSLP